MLAASATVTLFHGARRSDQVYFSKCDVSVCTLLVGARAKPDETSVISAHVRAKIRSARVLLLSGVPEVRGKLASIAAMRGHA